MMKHWEMSIREGAWAGTMWMGMGMKLGPSSVSGMRTGS